VSQLRGASSLLIVTQVPGAHRLFVRQPDQHYRNLRSLHHFGAMQLHRTSLNRALWLGRRAVYSALCAFMCKCFMFTFHETFSASILIRL
jgi:hypothetical protein